MRVFIKLSVAIVAAYYVICNVTADSNHDKMSMLRSTNGYSDSEERGLFDIRGLFQKSNKAKEMAEKILHNTDKMDDVFKAWAEKSYTLNDISSFVKAADKNGKYDSIYNGYALYLGYLGY
ncbi:Avirulence (Avh) protein [Phytophthora megakarya]|uniref:RxLR effector protein n=1 Tax=Phytophthora megakarya TaxID=4795 RepID=A0A225WUY1_9STRA|nr:Avirulence (Avh) protein [Phytophthora megakarya]